MAKKKKTDFDVESILQDFADLPDPRSHINQRHLLGDVIVVSIMAVIAGAEGPKAIGVWAKSNEVWLGDVRFVVETLDGLSSENVGG
ncbi:transposase family protein [Rhodopirellula baltica]